jgi:co-chaperonin GroES (HSP10)
MKAVKTIIVKVHKKFEDEIALEGITLYKDTTYAPEWNAICYGEVIAAPDTKVVQDPIFGDFHMPVKQGDKLYFHYNVLLDPYNYIYDQGEDYYSVDYHLALATVRDGEVIPCGGYSIMDPIEEEVSFGSLHVPEMCKKFETNRATVFATNEKSLSPGDVVEIENMAKFENTIEGRKVFLVQNNDIFLVYNK